MKGDNCGSAVRFYPTLKERMIYHLKVIEWAKGVMAAPARLGPIKFPTAILVEPGEEFPITDCSVSEQEKKKRYEKARSYLEVHSRFLQALKDEARHQPDVYSEALREFYQNTDDSDDNLAR